MTAVTSVSLPKVRFKDAQIEMSHGAGGTASRRLVEGLIVPLLGGIAERGTLDDAALVTINGRNIAITTDSFVVRPLRFPGGSIGELAVNGTVNDLAVSGAKAIALVTTFVLEAGLPTAVLEAEVRAMADAARRAGVAIVGGDTKVVEHGNADGLYITTTGVGTPMQDVALNARLVRPADRVIVSGPIGNHGVHPARARRARSGS
jgi:hydrogenase expression/formation protein HypE